MANIVRETLGALKEEARALDIHARHLYRDAVVKTALKAIAVVLVMWFVNIIGLKELNWAFFFAGAGILAIWGFSPRRLLLAVGAGALIQGLRDEDITQGAVKGVQTLYQVVLGVMVWFMVAAGILSVISFQGRPGAFFPILGMLLLITVAHASVKSNGAKRLITWAGALVIIYNLWGLIPQDWKFWSSWGKTSGNTQTLPQGQPMVQEPQKLMVFNSRIDADGEEIPAVYSGVRYSFIANNEEPKALQGRSGFCLRIETDTPNVRNLDIRHRGVSMAAGWIDDEEYDRRTAAGLKLPFVEIYLSEVKAKGEPVKVYYEYIYRPNGRCPK